MPKIFISYRREDSKYPAGEIAKRLAAAFGQTSIIYDVDNIPPGQDFRTHIKQELKSCDLLLAVIGERWLDACDKQGRPRLEQTGDWVRLELEAALERDIPLIPVLLDNVLAPNPGLLPKSLKPLAYRQAHSVRPPSDFDHDVQILIQKIKDRQKSLTQTVKLAGGTPQPALLSRWKHRRVLIGAAVIAVIAILASLFVFTRKSATPQVDAATADQTAADPTAEMAILDGLADDDTTDAPTDPRSPGPAADTSQFNLSGRWANPRGGDEYAIVDNGSTIEISLTKPKALALMTATFRRTPNGPECVVWNAARAPSHRINGKGARLIVLDPNSLRIGGLRIYSKGPKGAVKWRPDTLHFRKLE